MMLDARLCLPTLDLASSCCQCGIAVAGACSGGWAISVACLLSEIFEAFDTLETFEVEGRRTSGSMKAFSAFFVTVDLEPTGTLLAL